MSGVSGLMANSTAVSRISYNIANSDTYGFRRSFAQMLTAGSGVPSGMQEGSGVRAEVTHENGKEGTLLATGNATNLAISGNGFFAVTRGVDAGKTSEEMDHYLTRAGDFQPDSEGYLRNSAGYYLSGFPYDETGSLGVVDRNQYSGLQSVRIADMSVAGNPTSKMTLAGNLPSQESGLATPGDPFVSSIEYFTPLGAAERLQFSWQPSSTANEWTLAVSDSKGNTYGELTASFNDSGPLAGTPKSFSGVSSTATAPAAFSFDTATGQATITVNNGTTPQVISVDMGAPNSFGGLSQFSGAYVPLVGNADGTQSGTLARAEISAEGTVFGIFDNGMRRALFQIPLATVANPNGLITSDNSTFLVGEDSGSFTLAEAGTGATGEITGGAIESSNVDIAQELTELIQKQRAFSSNAKIITTADEMLDETVRLKR